MSKGGSNAGSYDYVPAPRSHHGGSIARYSRTERDVGDGHISTTSVSVTRKKEGPPISYNSRYGVDREFPSQRRSQTGGGSIRAPSVASGGTARPPPSRSESRSRASVTRLGSPERQRPLQHKSGSSTSKKPESVSSDRTVRPLKPRAREGDTDSRAGRESYTSGRESYTSGRRSYASKQDSGDMVPEEGRGSLYKEEWENGRSVYLQKKPRDGVSRSEALKRTSGSGHEMARLLERTGGLNLNPPDDNGLGDLESVAMGEDHNGPDPRARPYEESTPKGHRSERSRSNAADSYTRSRPSNPSYISPPPGSFASGFPPSGNRSHTSNDLALAENRSTRAPSTNRSNTSYNNGRSNTSEHQSHLSRNPPPSYGRGTYHGGHHNFGVVDLAQTHVNVTNIHGPNMGDMFESRKERRAREDHERNLEMIRHGMRPPVKKGIWDD